MENFRLYLLKYFSALWTRLSRKATMLSHQLRRSFGRIIKAKGLYAESSRTLVRFGLSLIVKLLGTVLRCCAVPTTPSKVLALLGRRANASTAT